MIYEEEYAVAAQTNPKPHQKLSHLLKIGKYRKQPDVEYETESILAGIKNKGDPYTFSSVLRTVETAYYFLNLLSQSTTAQRELLLTGCYLLGLAGWQMKLSSKHAALHKSFPLDYLNAFGALTFRHLAAFAVELSESVEPLDRFKRVIEKFLCEYMLRQLLQKIEVAAHKIKEPGRKSTIESIVATMDKLEKDIEHPECLWNESTRKEFHDAVIAQYEFYHREENVDESNFVNILNDLEYTAYKEEVKVGGIFIRLVNKDPYRELADPTKAVKSVFQALSNVPMDTPEAVLKTKVLLQALHNMILCQKRIDFNPITQEDITTLCSFIDPTAEESTSDGADIYNFVLGILVELTKYHRQTMNIIQCRGFLRLAFSQLAHQKDGRSQKTVMACMENVILQSECDPTVLRSGLLLVFLSNGIDRRVNRASRVAQLRFAQEVLARNSEKKPEIEGLRQMVPKVLLDQLTEKNYKTTGEWIEYLDGEKKEIYYTWNEELYSHVMKGFEEEIRKVEAQVMAEENVAWEPPKESYIGEVLNKGELVVEGVVVSMFVRNPYVNIRVFF